MLMFFFACAIDDAEDAVDVTTVAVSIGSNSF